MIASNAIGPGPASDTATARPFGTVTSAPLDLVATAADGAANLQWRRPADLGGLPLQSYVVSIRSDGGVELARQRVTAAIDGEIVLATVPGLRNRDTYRFAVQAANPAGLSPPSNTASATPRRLTAPGAPTDLLAEPGTNDARLSFREPADDGGAPVLSYRIIATNLARGGSVRVNLPASSIDDPSDASSARVGLSTIVVALGAGSLRGGDAYAFEVRALNAVGGSPRSAPAECEPLADGDRLDSPVRGLLAIATSDSGALLEWEEPFAAQGQLAPLEYLATHYPVELIARGSSGLGAGPDAPRIETAVLLAVNGTDPGSPRASTARPARLVGTVPGLAFNETYAFYVTVANAGGASPPSVPTVASVGAPFVCASFSPDSVVLAPPPPLSGGQARLEARNRANLAAGAVLPGTIVLAAGAGLDDASVFTSNFSALQLDEEGAAFVRFGSPADDVEPGEPPLRRRRALRQAAAPEPEAEAMTYAEFLASSFPALGAQDLALNPGDASYSVAVWARLSPGADGPVRIIGKDAGAPAGGFSVRAADAGVLFEVTDTDASTASVLFTDVDAFDGAYHWFLLSIDYDALEVRAYVDGAPPAAPANATLAAGGFVFSPAPLLVGRAEESTLPAPGAVDGAVAEVSVFRRALPADEAAALYAEYFSAAPAPLSVSLCGDVEAGIAGVLERDSGPPGAPFGAFANPSQGSGTVSLSWNAPDSDGNYPVTEFLVDVYRLGAGGARTLAETLTRALGDPFTFLVFRGRLVTLVAGLEPGAAYEFEVAAVNAAGAGEPSEPTAAVTPF